MLALIILLAVVVAPALTATIVAVRRDGRGHTPPVQSTRPWSADGLPSQPYASMR
ncbi:hypothetical protein [Arthrobacter sp. ov118]|jgi:hypothetical protein|uniref:hypothetical protein n=1 Tax=Arthrobacter sp. ov118 TaxID=1761747 RepID=UPI0008F031C5|nr:hypothetical protein [Arthrobacter sp. ov118]SFT97404.1 hypothetical protein SAMN04487915_106230 [Arthrobacter sp. ov118]